MPDMSAVDPSAGAATDSAGRAARDPSANVLDLAEAAAKRADDLRDMAEQCRLELQSKDGEIEVWKFRFYEERDRRLSEVALEREKALKIKDDGDIEARRIKEEADKEARQLAQRAQEDRDAAAAKASDFVLAQTTRNEGASTARGQQAVNLNLLLGVAGLLLTVVVVVIGLVIGAQ